MSGERQKRLREIARERNIQGLVPDAPPADLGD
jgi:hypothetical protein